MTQIEKKLNKLPEKFKKRLSGIKDVFCLDIKKKDGLWIMKYESEKYDYTLIEIVHENLQVVVDTMLSELKRTRMITG